MIAALTEFLTLPAKGGRSPCVRLCTHPSVQFRFPTGGQCRGSAAVRAVTVMTFLGGVIRVSVRLDGDLSVLVDRPSAEAARIHVGAAVKVAVSYQVLVVDPPAR